MYQDRAVGTLIRTDRECSVETGQTLPCWTAALFGPFIQDPLLR